MTMDMSCGSTTIPSAAALSTLTLRFANYLSTTASGSKSQSSDRPQGIQLK